MQSGKLFFQRSLLCLALLAIFPGVSWAASSFKADSSGFCCAKNDLQESTEKQCKKLRGKYYPVKERVTAQKECRSKAGNGSGKVSIPAKAAMSGFCCANGSVKKTTQAQCSKMKGSYYRGSAEARKACKPKDVFCCTDGKISERSPAECKKRKGTAYKTAAEAKTKCKPADIYCCVDGKIKKSSSKQCKQRKGTAYATATEAKRKCKPADVYCCVNGIVRKMSSKQCSSRKATAYKTRTEAEKVCREKKASQNNQLLQGKNSIARLQKGKAQSKNTNIKVGKVARYSPNSWTAVGGYCCDDRKVSKKSQKECEQKKGVYFKSRINAEKACRAQKGGSIARKEKSRQNNKSLQQHLSAVATARFGQITPALQHVKVVGAVQPGQITPASLGSPVGNVARGADSSAMAAGAEMQTCKVNGWVAINGLAPTVPVSLRLTSIGSGGQGGVSTASRLSLDGSFSLRVIPGTYRLQPLFSIPSGQQEQISIPANEFVCQPDMFPEFSSTFNWPESSSGNTTPPPMCVLTGKVLNDHGTGLYEMTGISVSNTSTGTVKPVDFYPATATYEVEIPAGSSYRLDAAFEEGSRLATVERTFTIESDKTRDYVDLVINRGAQHCNINGTILVDGHAPIEELMVYVTPTTGGGRISRIPSSGSFSLRIPEGNYRIEPLFPAGSVYGEGIPAQNIICQVDFVENINVDFDYTAPPVCILSGRINVNGANGSGVDSLTLRSLAAGGETTTVPVNGVEYRVEIPWGASYTLIPNVGQGAAAPETKEFTIYPAQRSLVVDFELNAASFRLARLELLGFDQNDQLEGMPTMVKFLLHTIGTGGEGRYNRSVRITSPESAQIYNARNCVFSSAGKCEFRISLDGMNVQTDSIRAEIVGFEDEPGGTRIWDTPFRQMAGDLRPAGYSLLQQNDNTIKYFSVKNISTAAASRRCRMDVKINGSNSLTVQIPPIAAGGEKTIRMSGGQWGPRRGDLLSFQIDDSCDNYSHNNQVSHRVTEEQITDHRYDDTSYVPDIIGGVEAIGDFLFSW